MDKFNQDIYRRAGQFVLSEKLLRIHGFPRPDPTRPGCALLYDEDKKVVAVNEDHHERRCARCHKTYVVQLNGEPVLTRQCRYHWLPVTGRARPHYQCCGASTSPYEDACMTAPCHISIQLFRTHMEGFVDIGQDDTDVRKFVVGLGFKVIYTLAGTEVASVCLVDACCRILYEILIKPEARVLDYETLNSGLLEKDFEGVTTKLADVQNKMKYLLTPGTIVVGHNISEALVHLRVIHHRIIDTSLLYPHPRGPPEVYTANELSRKYLKLRYIEMNTRQAVNDARAAVLLLCKSE